MGFDNMTVDSSHKNKFLTKFHSLYSNDFQTWFEEIMCAISDDGDFQRIRQAKGDGGLDCIVLSQQLVYQVYAPRRISDSATAKKILSDYELAAHTVGSAMREWIFVFNDVEDKLGKKCASALLHIREVNPAVKVSAMGRETLWGKVRSLPETSIKKLCFQYNDSDLPDQSGIPKSVVRGLPARFPFFSGRSEELAGISSILNCGGEIQIMRRWVVLTGIPGVGKTDLAAEFCHSSLTQDLSVLWLDAETQGDFERKLADFAYDLNPDLPSGLAEENRLQLVKDWLKANSEWLVVLDNAHNLEAWYTTIQALGDGRVLITARENAPALFQHSILIEPFTPEEGARVLCKRAALNIVDTDPSRESEWSLALEISNLLGGLPLALDYAGGYIDRYSISFAAYLQDYRLMGQRLHSLAPYLRHEPLSVCLAVILSKLATESDPDHHTLELARKMSIMAPDPVPDTVFIGEHIGEKRSRLSSPEFHQISSRLSELGLVRRDRNFSSMKMHRLTAEHIQLTMDSRIKAKLIRQRLRHLQHCFPVPEVSNWPECSQLLPHIRKCLDEWSTKGAVNSESITLLNRASEFLNQRSSYEEALTFSGLAVGLCETGKVRGPAAMISSLRIHGMTLTNLGQYDSALSPLMQSIRLCRENKLHRSLICASCLNSMGLTLYYVGKRDGDSVIVKKSSRVLYSALTLLRSGEMSDPILEADVLNNYAIAIRPHDSSADPGDPKFVQACKYAEESARLCKHIDSQSPAYATCLMNLGSLYVLWRKPELARPHLEQSLLLAQHIFGEQHWECSYQLYWIASMHHKLGDIDMAIRIMTRVVEVRRRFLGEKHPATEHAAHRLEILKDSLLSTEHKADIR